MNRKLRSQTSTSLSRSTLPAYIQSSVDKAVVFINSNEFAQAEQILTEAYQKYTSLEEFDEHSVFTLLKHRAEAKLGLHLNAEALSDLQYLRGLLSNSAYLAKVDALLVLVLANEKKEQERDRFMEVYRVHATIVPGDSWYVVSVLWLSKWFNYVGLNPDFEEFSYITHRSLATRPGPIDNSDILQTTSELVVLRDVEYEGSDCVLKQGLIENIHYASLPSEAYQVLAGVYGVKNQIRRGAIEISESIYRVEVHLALIRFVVPARAFVLELMQVSHKCTLNDFKRKIIKAKDLPGEVRVWRVNSAITSIDRLSAIALAPHPVYLEGASLLTEECRLDDLSLTTSDLIIIEPTANGRFLYSDDPSLAQGRCWFCQGLGKPQVSCKRCHAAKYCSDKCRNSHTAEHRRVCRRPSSFSLLKCLCMAGEELSDSEEEAVNSPIQRNRNLPRFGWTGLHNLGNSCFLNSALQCLSHTEQLTQYFLSSSYAADVNTNNPLGSNGKLTYLYCEVLDHLWNGNAAAYAPHRLKKGLGKLAPIFLGNQQHDVHELLCYFLDALHEDLNKVKVKPFFADEKELENKSEDEIAEVSWKRHLLRNQSVVQDLLHGQYKSTIYCPKCQNYSYSYDSFNMLSLPLPQRSQALYFVPSGNEALPQKLELKPEFKKIRQIRAHLSKSLGLGEDRLIFTSVENNSIQEILGEDTPITPNLSLFIYEIGEIRNQVVPVEVQVSVESGIRPLAYPRFLLIDSSNSLKDLHQAIFKKFYHYMPEFKDKPLNYKKFLSAPQYKLFIQLGVNESCPFCRKRECLGCEIPFTSDKLLFLPTNEIVTIELKWTGLANKIMQMNRCAEDASDSCRVEDCFELLSAPEVLDKENAWHCEKCNSHVEATKKLEIYRAPKILIVHLKRFKTKGFKREKVTDPVMFPLENLQITQFVKGPVQPPVYDLFAIANHVGNLASGHYTATCFNKGQWLEFNDDKVDPAESISASSAYILFYKSRES